MSKEKIQEIIIRNNAQQIANCLLPKNEEESELIKIFNEILKCINKELEEFLKEPTLEECIKEWEERGFVFSNYDTLLIFKSVAKDISIEIYTNHMEITVWDYECNEIQSLDFDLVFLLSKTLKALEVENG